MDQRASQSHTRSSTARTPACPLPPPPAPTPWSNAHTTTGHVPTMLQTKGPPGSGGGLAPCTHPVHLLRVPLAGQPRNSPPTVSRAGPFPADLLCTGCCTGSWLLQSGTEMPWLKGMHPGQAGPLSQDLSLGGPQGSRWSQAGTHTDTRGGREEQSPGGEPQNVPESQGAPESSPGVLLSGSATSSPKTERRERGPEKQ